VEDLSPSETTNERTNVPATLGKRDASARSAPSRSAAPEPETFFHAKTGELDPSYVPFSEIFFSTSEDKSGPASARSGDTEV
jgi:hypothetical protein